MNTVLYAHTPETTKDIVLKFAHFLMYT